MEQENTHHTIAIDTPKGKRLPLGQMNQAENEHQEQHQYSGRPPEPFFFPDRTENEISILFRHILQLGLRSVQEAFSS